MAAVSASFVGTAPPPSNRLEYTPAAEASIAAYNRSAERMLGVTDVMWKICVGLFGVVAVAWIIGVLPGAVRLF